MGARRGRSERPRPTRSAFRARSASGSAASCRRHRGTFTRGAPMQMATHTAEACRLVTRSDFDGLVCAALLTELDMLDEIKFVHPKDMQDGPVPVSDRD